MTKIDIEARAGRDPRAYAKGEAVNLPALSSPPPAA